MTIPIQALTVRTGADIEAAKDGKGSVQAAAPKSGSDKEQKQGVFVIRNGKAEFVPLQTGIAGTTDIEVLGGLKEDDEVVTGSYKVLRTMKPGASVKVDNAEPKKEEES